MEFTQSQLMIVGSLTGAAAHELNNIMGILSLRLEKIQDDLEPRPLGDDEIAQAELERARERDQGARKDLAVMDRNLQRAVRLIGRLQGLMRAGDDRGSCSQPEDFRAAILEAIETQQAIYERKVALEHAVGLVNVRPVHRGRLHLFLVGALQRVFLSLGRGATLQVNWSLDSSTDGGSSDSHAHDGYALLEITGRAALSDAAQSLPRGPGGPEAVLDLLADQTETLAASLAPDTFQPGDFKWSVESASGAGDGAPERRARLSLRLPA